MTADQIAKEGYYWVQGSVFEREPGEWMVLLIERRGQEWRCYFGEENVPLDPRAGMRFLGPLIPPVDA